MGSEFISKSLQDAVKKHSPGSIIMVEMPSESYLDNSILSIKSLLEMGFGGVYISFQRPFNNIESIMEKAGLDLHRMKFIDTATSASGEKIDQDERCVHISENMEVDEIITAIYKLLPKVDGDKKFIFMDSLTTITLYKPLSEIMRLSEFLIRNVRKHQTESVILVFNVSKDLTQKRFIKEIALKVDDVVSVV